jgi:hypothetical protein
MIFQLMKAKFLPGCLGLYSLLWTATVFGQTAGAPGSATDQANPEYSAANSASGQSPQGGPVSYASVTQLNGLLAQLEATSKTTREDLAKLRIERW